jgi:hypothetical protein
MPSIRAWFALWFTYNNREEVPMIVTMKAPSPSAAKRGAFQAFQMGLECEVLADSYLDLTVQDLWKAKHLAGMIDADIVAVVDKSIIDPREV